MPARVGTILVALLLGTGCGSTPAGRPFQPGTTPPLAAQPRPGGWWAAILPPSVVLNPGGRQQFTLSVRGLPSYQARWGVVGPGTISPTGLYTAPAQIPTGSGPAIVTAQIHQGTVQVNQVSARVAITRTGGVILVKLQSAPPALRGKKAAAQTGLVSLDAVLANQGVQGVFPAFPFGLQGKVDTVHLDRWIFLLLDPTRDSVAALRAVTADANVERESASYSQREYSYHSFVPRHGSSGPIRRPTGAASSVLCPMSSVLGPKTSDVGRGTSDTAADRFQTHVRPYVGDDPREWDVQDVPVSVRTEFGSFTSVAGAGVNVQRAWSLATGRGVTIAVVDTGVDVNHVDIAPNLWINRRERRHSGGFVGTDADGNGIPNDYHGASFTNLKLTPGRMDLAFAWDVSDWFGADMWNGLNPLPPGKWGHGTAVASIAAGAKNNLGRCGVAYNAKIMVVDTQANVRPVSARQVDPASVEPRQVASIQLPSTDWAKAAGIVYACVNGARVLNCSWSDEHALWLLWDVCKFASDNGCVLVCAVGEARAGPGGTTPRYPAAWGHRRDRFDGNSNAPDRFPSTIDGVVAVGASDENNRKAHYSDYGSRTILAPGGSGDVSRDPVTGDPKIIAAASFPGDDARPQPGKDRGMKWFSGTSAAAPYVSGAVALMLEVKPTLTSRQIRSILLRTAARTRDGYPKLDVDAAVRAARRTP